MATSRQRAEPCQRGGSPAARRRGADRGDPFPGSAIKHRPHRQARIFLELRFGDTWLLEVQLIELSLSRLRHQAGRARRTARPEWHAEADDCTETIRTQTRGLPGDSGAPIMADDDGRGGL